MGIPNIFQTGRSGMVAAKTGLATTGHNITNAGTEGFSRQRVHLQAAPAQGGVLGHHVIGTGTRLGRVDRVTDDYIERQLRAVGRDLGHGEEKDLVLRQIEDVFNEMNGEGLNRQIGKFFNDFRKLSENPENGAVRGVIRQSSLELVETFHRLSQQVQGVSEHIDQKIQGYVVQINDTTAQLSELNRKIHQMKGLGDPANDLLDQRNLALKQLESLVEVGSRLDERGLLDVDLKGAGPLLYGLKAETLSAERAPSGGEGERAGRIIVHSTGSAVGNVTREIRGGRLGALIEVRDQLLGSIGERLDQLASQLSGSINAVHRQGFNLRGETEVDYFAPLEGIERAAETLQLSSAVQENALAIACAAVPDAPGDNRIALAIAELQHLPLVRYGSLVGDGLTPDSAFDALVGDIAAALNQNRFFLNQEKDMQTQLGKIREQISGVSLDEETTHLLEFQHAFDASAKVIQVADEMLRTVLSLKRD